MSVQEFLHMIMLENNLKTKLNEATATPTTTEGLPW